ncbi:hypothetical protein [Salinispira pacifica]|uniref:Uncharacterized protein n=1 Tax=Salinispira pacifica TaxID=1307761 RepID=V5WH83_9SPIO|nr:hypothetical protein [Salinispira pacifica]AHC15158.1 hypothetical protein L21SP2_1781 [Salinispira pacifica]
MQIYVLYALSILLVSLLVTVYAFYRYRPRGMVRILFTFMISMFGAALGLLLQSLFRIDQRSVNFLIQFLFSGVFSILMVKIFYFIRSRPDQD